MANSSHIGVITELNLGSYQPYTLVERINSVPGLKTSAAFLTFLRANLVLAHSICPSATSTPTLRPQHPPSRALPALIALSPLSYPSPASLHDDDDLAAEDDSPPPSLELLTDSADKAAALRLIADSIVQQQHKAAIHLATHPLPLAALLAVLAGISRTYYAYADSDFAGTAFLLAILSACAVYGLVIRYFTSGYLGAAEKMGRDFLACGGGYEDLVLATKYGGEIIGALVLRLERPLSCSSSSDNSSPSASSGSNTCPGGGRRKGHSRQNSLRSARPTGKGIIRAWTTRLGYRGRGLGVDMLREAVRVTRERCGRDAEVGFAREHANSVKVLPEVFNRPFRRGEMRAARCLERIVKEEKEGRRRR